MADRAISDEDVGGKYRYQPRPMPDAEGVISTIADQVGANKDNPADLWRFFNWALGVENPPRGRTDAEVTGPGRRMLQRNIPERLFQYLDRSPMKIDVAAPGQNFPPELKGWANGGYKARPAREGGTIGRIHVEPEGATPRVLTHEAMHAATDLSTINKMQRAGDPGFGPMEGFLPRAARPGLLSDTPNLYKATEGMIHRDPTLIDFGNGYMGRAKDHQIRAEVTNEGQARNAIQAVPELAKRENMMDVPRDLRSWSNLFGGLKDELKGALMQPSQGAAQPAPGMEANPSVSLDRVVRALESMRYVDGEQKATAREATQAILENPGRFEKFLAPFSDSSKVGPLGAGAESAAVRIGDKAVKFSPHQYNPAIDKTIKHWQEVGQLPQVLGPERIEVVPPFKQPIDMPDFSTLVTQQPLGMPAAFGFRGNPNSYRPSRIEQYFNSLWEPHGYRLSDSHQWNVGIPYPPGREPLPHLIDLGAASPYAPQRQRVVPANTDEILGIR